MSDGDRLGLLRAELEHDFSIICENAGKNRDMTARLAQTAAPDEFDYAALGYTLHNLYNAFEGYFLRVAKFFENEIESEGWHKSLLDRMTLAVPELRPALIDRVLADRLRELLMFRHAFRNVYSSTLIPEKVLFVNRIAEKIDEDLRQCHEQFTLFLDSLARQLDDDADYE